MTPTGRTLGDYFDLQRGTTYKSKLLGQPGPLLLGLATIERNGGFRRDSVRTYGGDSPERLIVRPGELYVSLKDVTQSADLLGAVARLPADSPPGRLTQDTVRLVPKDARAPLTYLYWLLRTPQYRSYCRTRATGTTNLGLAREDFLAYPVPELTSNRQVIVQALEAIEQKIEFERHLYKLLDAVQRVVFKLWFVDFNPAAARSHNRGQRGPVPRLLGSRTPSELWEVTKPWTVGRFADVVEHQREQVKPLDSPDELFAHYSIPAFDLNKRPWMELGANIKSAKWRVPPGSVLLSKLNPEIERVWAADVQGDERAVCSTEFLVLLPRAPFGRTFLYCLAQSDAFRRHIESLVTGTSKSHQRAPAKAVLDIPVVLPPVGILERFEEHAGPILGRALLVRRHTEILAGLRDRLLPRLASGELVDPKAEHLVEAAV